MQYGNEVLLCHITFRCRLGYTIWRMQYGNEVVLCYITDYKRLLVMFSGQAQEKAGYV